MTEPTMKIFGAYATPAGICVQTSQDNIITEINKLRALIPDPAVAPANSSNRGGSFDAVSPQQATQLRAEILAITTAIDAMAVA